MWIQNGIIYLLQEFTIFTYFNLIWKLQNTIFVNYWCKFTNAQGGEGGKEERDSKGKRSGTWAKLKEQCEFTVTG